MLEEKSAKMALGLIMVVKSEPLGDRHIKSRLLSAPRAKSSSRNPLLPAVSTLLKQLSCYPPTQDCTPEPTEDDIEPLLGKPNCCIFYHSVTEQLYLKLNQ